MTEKMTPKARTLGSKEVASKFNLDPKRFRQILRSMGKMSRDKHTRYEWEENDPFLKKLSDIIAKYKAEHENKKSNLPPKKKVKAKPATEEKSKAKLPPKKQKKAKAAAAGAGAESAAETSTDDGIEVI